MLIQTEATPNPETLKFIPGFVVNKGQAVEFHHTDDSINEKSPLAAKIFDIEGIVRIFIGHDFVSITKDSMCEWYELKPAILGVMMQHHDTGQENVIEQGNKEDDFFNQDDYNEEELSIISQIQELLEQRVRPFVEQDGGSIVFQGFDKGIVYLSMRGACAGCPSSTATLKMGIERMLTHYIPEIIEVRAAL